MSKCELLAALRSCAYRLEMSRQELRILNDELGRADDEQNIAADEADQVAVSDARAAITKAEGGQAVGMSTGGRE